MRALVCLALLPGSAAFADADRLQFQCVFSTECVDAEPCEITDYSLTFDFPTALILEAEGLLPPTDDTRLAQIETQVDTFEAQAWAAQGGLVIGWTELSDEGHLKHLSLSDGTARYSVQLPAWETAIYYEGTCEETPS